MGFIGRFLLLEQPTVNSLKIMISILPVPKKNQVCIGMYIILLSKVFRSQRQNLFRNSPDFGLPILEEICQSAQAPCISFNLYFAMPRLW